MLHGTAFLFTSSYLTTLQGHYVRYIPDDAYVALLTEVAAENALSLPDVQAVYYLPQALKSRPRSKSAKDEASSSESELRNGDSKGTRVVLDVLVRDVTPGLLSHSVIPLSMHALDTHIHSEYSSNGEHSCMFIHSYTDTYILEY